MTVSGRPDDLTGRLWPGEQLAADGAESRVPAEVYLATADLADGARVPAVAPARRGRQRRPW
ncbi:hypothetical protein [Streptomyces hokutonensis]|uniref:hypothetical protein n=1 Tax=Streptomyces hokutonensis TaxID=1306990 RepID=UPI0036C31399